MTDQRKERGRGEGNSLWSKEQRKRMIHVLLPLANWERNGKSVSLIWKSRKSMTAKFEFRSSPRNTSQLGWKVIEANKFTIASFNFSYHFGHLWVPKARAKIQILLPLTIVPSSFLPTQSEVQQSDLVSFCFALNWRFLTLSLFLPRDSCAILLGRDLWFPKHFLK